MNKHGHISFWSMIAWFLERLTPATDLSDSQYLLFFFFHRPIFCLDRPLRVFNLTDFYFFFFFFLNAFSEKNLRFIATWKIWLIAPVWYLLLVLVGNKHVTEANLFLFFFCFWVEGSKGYPTHVCQYAIMKEINFLCQALKLRQIFYYFYQ